MGNCTSPTRGSQSVDYCAHPSVKGQTVVNNVSRDTKVRRWLCQSWSCDRCQDRAQLSPLPGSEHWLSPEVRKLCHRLQIEPSLPADRGSQFYLFTNFLRTVESTRRHVMGLVAICNAEFRAVLKLYINRGIQVVDQRQNMAVCTTHGRWIVGSMLEQAAWNKQLLLELLGEMQTKLDLLARSSHDCPICLETMPASSGKVVLECCHVVCDSCWQLWQARNEGRAQCPVCRHDQSASMTEPMPSLELVSSPIDRRSVSAVA